MAAIIDINDLKFKNLLRATEAQIGKKLTASLNSKFIGSYKKVYLRY